MWQITAPKGPAQQDGTLQLLGTKEQKFLQYPGTKRQMGQAQNLATRRDGPGQPVKILDGIRNSKGQSLFFFWKGHKSAKLKGFFWVFWECVFFPGCPGTDNFALGFFLLSLPWDKGTSRQGNIFIPGKRDNPLETLTCSRLFHGSYYSEKT